MRYFVSYVLGHIARLYNTNVYKTPQLFGNVPRLNGLFFDRIEIIRACRGIQCARVHFGNSRNTITKIKHRNAQLKC